MPPLAPAVIVPVPPKQLGCVGVAVAITCVGTVMVACAVPVQPLASLAVIVYVPALNPLNVGEAWKVIPSLEKV